MPKKKSTRRSRRRRQDDEEEEEEEIVVPGAAAAAQAPEVAAGGRSVATHVRDWQRAVAEREASRLARPEARPKSTLGHADRKKSAVSSTPFGVLPRPEKGDPAVVEAEKHEWCGPFSVARRMIAKREEARRKREAELEGQNEPAHPLDEAMEEMDMERKRKLHPSMQWKGRMKKITAPKNIYAKRQQRLQSQGAGKLFPSLFDLCVDFLVDNFEYVEGLGDVDNAIRTAIARELVAQNKLNAQSFSAIAEVGIEALEMVDCSGITQDQLSKAMRDLLPAGLRYLVLDQAGRCVGTKTVQAIVEASDKCSLFALSIGGAYLLKDADAAKLVKAVCKTVSSLEFKACPMLGIEFVKSLNESFDSSSGNLVELALEDVSLSKECFETLLPKESGGGGALKNLKNLCLQRIDGLANETLDKVLQAAGTNLEQLDLSDCYNLTDSSLASIRRYNPNLKNLGLAGLKHLTSEGLEALFTHVAGTDQPPPMLRTLDVSNCDYEAVTDQVIELVTQAATTVRSDKAATGVVDQKDLRGGLVQLSMQGSSVVTDTALECLVATCSKTLQQINLSFCPKVSDKGLGYLVDRCGPQLSKIEIWGCAQVTDEFLDGHHRVEDSSLVIAGAWIKKNSTRTMR